MHNPYLSQVISGDGLRKFSSFTIRDKYVAEYSWSIPTAEAVEAIVELGPVVEGGAGTGYWASLIASAGGDIVAYDAKPPSAGENGYRHTKEYFPIKPGGPEKMSEHKNRTLLLCWPPYCSSMGFEHIVAHGGKALVLIGEGAGGCCGDDKMFNYINNNYNHKKSIYIPQWHGIHDSVEIFSRKAE